MPAISSLFCRASAKNDISFRPRRVLCKKQPFHLPRAAEGFVSPSKYMSEAVDFFDAARPDCSANAPARWRCSAI